jgi:hypothetical protein
LREGEPELDSKFGVVEIAGTNPLWRLMILREALRTTARDARSRLPNEAKLSRWMFRFSEAPAGNRRSKPIQMSASFSEIDQTKPNSADDH